MLLHWTRTFSRQTRVALLAMLTVAGCAADVAEPEDIAAESSEALLSCRPSIPAELAVPEGNKLAFSLEAEGTQIYDCKGAADGSVAWVFRAPEADLFARHGRLAGSHYAGPTWEALDGSTVVGTRLAGVTVDATAIPWLLLGAASHTGKGLMSSVTHIQRLSTSGGLAPSSGCDAAHVGAVADVYYTATYAFYEAKRGRH